jgi:hypothetical protein
MMPATGGRIAAANAGAALTANIAAMSNATVTNTIKRLIHFSIP